MNGERILVVGITAVALLAFGVGAANLVGVVDDERPPPDVEEPPDRAQGEPPGPPENPERCLIGCGGARGLLDGAFAGLSTTQVLLAGGVAALVLGGVYLFARGESSGDEGVVGETPTVDPPAERDVGVHVPASPDVDATNAVYRAWRDLAADLDPGGEGTMTPAEYAHRARERGYDDDAVRALTEVFRQVRYGRAEVTSDRETAARRAIEDVLGEDDS